MKNRNAVIYAGAWGAIIAVAFFDFQWARHMGFRIGHGWPLFSALETCSALGVSAVFFWIATLQRYRQLTHALRCKEFASAIFCMITTTVWAQNVAIASYLGVGLNIPTIADTLVHFDNSIGFDWLSTYHWVSSHRILRLVLIYAYWSALAQFVLIPLVLAVVRQFDDIVEFLAILFISSFVLLLIAIPLPAESAFLHYGITDPGTSSSVQDFTLLRDGALKVINPYKIQGLVSMPSFHTMLAIFFAYSVRRVRFVFAAAVALNAIMIASTITVGGHYLADVLAGIVCGFAVILAVRLGFRRRPTDVGNAYRASNAGGSISAQ